VPGGRTLVANHRRSHHAPPVGESSHISRYACVAVMSTADRVAHVDWRKCIIYSSSVSPLLLLCLHSALTKMHIRKKPHAICHSAGRVTAGLLLSFLALSNPSVASAAQKQQQPLPILNPVPSIPDNKPISSAGHVFVS
jgi:hypothetical protein